MHFVRNSRWCRHRESWWDCIILPAQTVNITVFLFVMLLSFFIRNINSSLEDVKLITSQLRSQLTQSSGWRCHLPESTLLSRCSWRKSECQWLLPLEGSWGQHSGVVEIWKNTQKNTLLFLSIVFLWLSFVYVHYRSHFQPHHNVIANVCDQHAHKQKHKIHLKMSTFAGLWVDMINIISACKSTRQK